MHDMTGARSNDSPQLPPLLAYFIEVTKGAGESKYAAVLTEFGQLAADYVANHDILPGLAHISRSATHEQLRDVALRHLGLGQLEWRLDGAIIRAAAGGERTAIHTALADVYIVRDTAHILWGLSIGLALCDHVGGMRR
jgi:hypothetical protein